MGNTPELTHSDPRMIPEAPIIKKLVLPCCWVCRKVFIDCDGDDPGIIREEHHPVPRAYGGANGPTVSLCTGHHTVLHKIADAFISEVRIDITSPIPHELLNNMSFQERKRVIYLSTVVFNAWKATKDDPNKKAPVTFELTGTQKKRLDALKRFHSLSTTNYLARLIDSEYLKYFP